MSEFSRRKFLKGVTLAGTAAAAGCSSESARKLIPYIIPPEDIVPGEATWYATTCRECPAGCGILAKNREGRVVKAEGNPLHPVKQGALLAGREGLRPCTPLGVMRLLEETGVPLEGAHAVVVGRSLLVGKPVALLLLERHATVVMCHSRTRNLAEEVGRAAVVVAAAGHPGLVRGAWIRPGAVVIDVGISRGVDGALLGDVEFDAARQRAGFITPVPGGIGPMIVAMLLANTVTAAERAFGSALA